jgi:uncharacterized protein
MHGPRDFPPATAWSHHGSRVGFEAVAIDRAADGWTLSGSTTAIEAGSAWHVSYVIDIDRLSITRRAEIETRTSRQRRLTLLEHDGDGEWLVDGRSAPRLDGCLDVDLEASALTNAFPVRRLLAAGISSREAAPAAYVRVHAVEVDRLDQLYERRPDPTDAAAVFAYRAPVFRFSCDITYDATGLVTSYPSIASRVPLPDGTTAI